MGMRNRFRKIAAAGAAVLIAGSALSFGASAVRSYDCEAEDYAVFSGQVGTFEERSTQDPAATLLVQTNGANPDFRSLHPQYTVKGPDDAYAVCFADAEEAELMRGKVEAIHGVEYAECNGLVYVQDELPQVPDEETPDTPDTPETPEEPNEEPYPAKLSWGVEYMRLDHFADCIRTRLGEHTREVIVALVDSGVHAAHPLFADRLVSGESFTPDPWNEDAYGHGTCVAGVVADCTRGLPVKLMPIKVLRDSGTATVLSASNAIRSAADRGADIINISFVADACYETLDDAVDYVFAKGSLPVICAGNKKYDLDNAEGCPSHKQNAIVVAGLAPDGSYYKKSGFGTCVDVCAPAVDVLCADRHGGYTLADGTSFAAPHIAAIAAMYKLYAPEADCELLSEMVIMHTRDLGTAGFDTQFGWGVPWFGKMVTQIEVLTQPKHNYYKSPFDPDGLTLRVTYDDGSSSTQAQTEKFTYTGTNDLKHGNHVIGVRYGYCTVPCTVRVRMHLWQWLIWIPLLGFLWY